MSRFEALGMQADSAQVLEAPEVDVDNVDFRQVKQEVSVRISDTPFHVNSLPRTLSLFCLSNKYGYFVAATPTGVRYGRLDDLRKTFYAAESHSIAKFTSGHFVPNTSGQTIQFLRISANERVIIVATVEGQMLFFEAERVQNGAYDASATINLNQNVRDIQPNPEGFPDLVAVLGHNGIVTMVSLTGNVVGQFGEAISAIRWSVRGKQLACGCTNGLIYQYTPDGQVKNQIPKPPDLDGPYMAADLQWLENFVFMCVYNLPLDGPEPNHSYELYVISRANANMPWSYYKLSDPVPAFGIMERTGFRHMPSIKNTTPFKHLVIMDNGPSADLGAIGNEPTNPDLSSSGGWYTVMPPETSRMSLGVSKYSEGDVCPIGLEIDFTAQSGELHVPGEEGQETNYPDRAPIIIAYTHEGLLMAWWICIIGGSGHTPRETYSGMITSRGFDEVDNTIAASPIHTQQASTTSMLPFKSFSAGPTGIVNPGFGQVSPLGAETQPGLGSSPSQFGAAAVPRSTFGSVPFGQTSQSSFGSTSVLGSSVQSAPGSTALLGSNRANFGSTSSIGSGTGPIFGSLSSLAPTSSTMTFGSTAFGQQAKSVFGGSTSNIPSFGTVGISDKLIFGAPSQLGANASPFAAISTNASQSSFGGRASFGSAEASFASLAESPSTQSPFANIAAKPDTSKRKSLSGVFEARKSSDDVDSDNEDAKEAPDDVMSDASIDEDHKEANQLVDATSAVPVTSEALVSEQRPFSGDILNLGSMGLGDLDTKHLSTESSSEITFGPIATQGSESTALKRVAPGIEKPEEEQARLVTKETPIDAFPSEKPITPSFSFGSLATPVAAFHSTTSSQEGGQDIETSAGPQAKPAIMELPVSYIPAIESKASSFSFGRHIGTQISASDSTISAHAEPPKVEKAQAKPVILETPTVSFPSAKSETHSFSFGAIPTHASASNATVSVQRPALNFINPAEVQAKPVVDKKSISASSSQFPQSSQHVAPSNLEQQFFKIYQLMCKEFQELEVHVKQSEVRIHQVATISDRAKMLEDLSDASSWTFGDLSLLSSLVTQLVEDAGDLNNQISSFTLGLKDLQSDLLKGESKRREADRYLRARQDEGFEMLVKERSLGPEAKENRQHLSTSSKLVKQRLEHLEDCLAILHAKAKQVKQNTNPVFKPPSLDTIKRTIRNITIGIEEQTNTLDEMTSDLNRMRLSSVTPRLKKSPFEKSNSLGNRNAQKSLSETLKINKLNSIHSEVSVAIARAAAQTLNAERFGAQLRRVLEDDEGVDQAVGRKPIGLV